VRSLMAPISGSEIVSQMRPSIRTSPISVKRQAELGRIERRRMQREADRRGDGTPIEANAARRLPGRRFYRADIRTVLRVIAQDSPSPIPLRKPSAVSSGRRDGRGFGDLPDDSSAVRTSFLRHAAPAVDAHRHDAVECHAPPRDADRRSR
jgi:hypothetical protein